MPGFPPVFPLFPPRFPFFAGFPYFGCYSFRDFPPPIPPASTGIPDPIPAAFPGSLPALAHPRDISGITRGVPKDFFFPGIRDFFPSGGWFGPGSAGIPAFPHSQFPPCQVTVLESRGAFRSRAQLCPAPLLLPSGRF